MSEDDFEEWWHLYPRKKDKGHARSAYRKARTKIGKLELILAVRIHAAEMRGRDPQFIPYPATWLNGERWCDEPDLKPTIEAEPKRDLCTCGHLVHFCEPNLKFCPRNPIRAN